MIIPNVMPNVASVGAHYDDLDDFYRTMWGLHVHHGYWQTGKESQAEAVEALVDLVATQARLLPNMRVCDIGSGYGATARQLVKKYSASVDAFTVSKAQYTHAIGLDRENPNPMYHLRDWCLNSMESEIIDAAISIESSEHFTDKMKFFSEAFRVIRPGGRLVVCSWLSSESPNRFYINHLLEPICREGRLPSMGTAAEYTKLMQDVGFRDVEYRDLSKNVKRTWKLCAQTLIARFFKDHTVRSYLFDPSRANRVFALTLFRVWLAYESGAMRYGIFTAIKPEDYRTGTTN